MTKIVVPADKLAAAVIKNLLPGVIRSLQQEQNITNIQRTSEINNTKGE